MKEFVENSFIQYHPYQQRFADVAVAVARMAVHLAWDDGAQGLTRHVILIGLVKAYGSLAELHRVVNEHHAPLPLEALHTNQLLTLLHSTEFASMKPQDGKMTAQLPARLWAADGEPVDAETLRVLDCFYRHSVLVQVRVKWNPDKSCWDGGKPPRLCLNMSQVLQVVEWVQQVLCDQSEDGPAAVVNLEGTSENWPHIWPPD